MLSEARDVLSALFFEKMLGRLRETHMQRVLEGEDPPPEFWNEGEERVINATKRKFYDSPTRALVKPDAASSDEDGDFDERTQRLAEQAILMTHHRLKDIPVVGQAGYEDAP